MSNGWMTDEGRTVKDLERKWSGPNRGKSRNFAEETEETVLISVRIAYAQTKIRTKRLPSTSRPVWCAYSTRTTITSNIERNKRCRFQEVLIN
jgi:hypothetical protein